MGPIIGVIFFFLILGLLGYLAWTYAAGEVGDLLSGLNPFAPKCKTGECPAGQYCIPLKGCEPVIQEGGKCAKVAPRAKENYGCAPGLTCKLRVGRGISCVKEVTAADVDPNCRCYETKFPYYGKAQAPWKYFCWNDRGNIGKIPALGSTARKVCAGATTTTAGTTTGTTTRPTRTRPTGCPAGKQLWAGLCYNACPAGSTREGLCRCSGYSISCRNYGAGAGTSPV